MASVTIRNIDEDVKRKLQIRAANNGRSMEQDLRFVLNELVEQKAPARRTPEEAEEMLRRIRAIVRPPLEPFDLKAASDELWDFAP